MPREPPLINTFLPAKLKLGIATAPERGLSEIGLLKSGSAVAIRHFLLRHPLA
jgi:hypothetical protein